ncbi:YesL family protein [Bacillus sp. EB106-08-02-XG196]|uniref:YesL family protein n=1 Tax=Bacillus sp. EB106-08-02-XG196 TaxID=2737049 RepID=UPI0015C40F5E|nr:YesL family protein [Bacillus sp. EB106-08-02-XG196]NWQ40259.1 YesL family protein [Bacillus sp. EB106-08-02-XG196]
MDTSGFIESLNKLLEWISRLAFLNLLWISFSLLGIIFFGFFPATVAMFAVVRKWMLGNDEMSIFKTFWTAYKRDFLKSNILGVIILAIGLILYIDFQFVLNASNSFVSILYVPLFIITFIFISMLFYIIPIFVHYDMKLSKVIKNSFFVMIMNPLSTFYLLIGSFGIVFVLSYAPPICILYSGNLLALFIMKPATNAFEKINQKSKLLVNL